MKPTLTDYLQGRARLQDLKQKDVDRVRRRTRQSRPYQSEHDRSMTHWLKMRTKRMMRQGL